MKLTLLRVVALGLIGLAAASASAQKDQKKEKITKRAPPPAQETQDEFDVPCDDLHKAPGADSATSCISDADATAKATKKAKKQCDANCESRSCSAGGICGLVAGAICTPACQTVADACPPAAAGGAKQPGHYCSVTCQCPCGCR